MSKQDSYSSLLEYVKNKSGTLMVYYKNKIWRSCVFVVASITDPTQLPFNDRKLVHFSALVLSRHYSFLGRIARVNRRLRGVNSGAVRRERADVDVEWTSNPATVSVIRSMANYALLRWWIRWVAWLAFSGGGGGNNAAGVALCRMGNLSPGWR